MVKEIMDGGSRPGGVRVSPAGVFHASLTNAFFWKLWEANFELPGFEEIYFHPTSGLPHGTYVVSERGTIFFESIRIGVDPNRFRKICRGEANMEGIDLFGGALRAFAKVYGLDVTAVAAACAAFKERGLDFEVLLKSKSVEGAELRAYLAVREKGKDMIIAEHRASDGRRAPSVGRPRRRSASRGR